MVKFFGALWGVAQFYIQQVHAEEHGSELVSVRGKVVGIADYDGHGHGVRGRAVVEEIKPRHDSETLPQGAFGLAAIRSSMPHRCPMTWRSGAGRERPSGPTPWMGVPRLSTAPGCS